jgi:hypothetical protein
MGSGTLWTLFFEQMQDYDFGKLNTCKSIDSGTSLFSLTQELVLFRSMGFLSTFVTLPNRGPPPTHMQRTCKDLAINLQEMQQTCR